MDIQKTAIESAKKYYQFSTEKNKSLAEHSIRRKEIKGSMISLYLFAPIASTEGLQIQIEEIIYTEEFKVVDYDKEHLCLRLIAEQPLEQALQRVPAEKIRLIFDLRFLIKRVKEWYEEFGDRIALPSKAPAIKPSALLIRDRTPSDDQKSAIDGVLSFPLTYVWGAPGTGKTQVVLAESILQCLKSGKRILLTAPTNRAVEQILYGVLPILESAGIRRELFLRMGTPTKEFAAQYSDVCENSHLYMKLEEIDALLQMQKDSLNEYLLKAEKFRNYEKDMYEYQDFRGDVSEIHTILEELAENEEIYIREKKIRTASDEDCHITRERLDLKRGQRTVQKKKVQSLAKKLKRLNATPLRSFFANRMERIQQEFEKATSLLDDLTIQENQLNDLFESTLQKRNKASEEARIAQARIKRLFRSLDFLHSSIKKYNPNNTPYRRSSVQEARIDFERWIANGEASFQHLLKEYGDDAEKTYGELNKQIEQIRAEIEKCEEQRAALKKQHNHRLSRCCVIATTLDLALVRIKPTDDFKPDHVFLDEAGYAPLIKTAPLTAYRCPLTLLGDHMQLPPVCEMSEHDLEKPENASIVLWTQSALYLEDLFLREYDMLYQRFLTHEVPFFRAMKKYDLLQSYRFGKELASILAGTVYAGALEGNDQKNTEIFFIHAPRNKGAVKRQSLAECEAIKNFVMQNNEQEIGVITPYRNQKEALKKYLPDFLEINTVHGSQGREWDCVIFSVVDTTDRFFTDSNHRISNGKKIVNTAISRAKKKLILVCDADYWKSQPSQLIGKIVSIGKELKL